MNRAPAGPIAGIDGTAIVLRGHDIDTDRIMPARFLRVVSFEGLGDHVFEDDRSQAAAHGHVHPFDDKSRREARLLVVNRNFGCGSSREHAPQGLLRWGIRALVGESFSEIFFGNATTLGLPCAVADGQAIARLMDVVDENTAAVATLDLDTMTVGVAGCRLAVSLPPAVRQAFLDGSWDATGVLLDDFDQVRRVAARLPYLQRPDPFPRGFQEGGGGS